MLNLEIDFIGNANGSSLLLKVGANLFARVSLVGEDFLPLEVDSFKQLQSRFAVVNLSACQNYVQQLHRFVEQDVNFGGFATS